ncbi:energy-coupling factor transport system permease protein [Agreia bicolorata]|uniref:Energy-coupling factor transport system permease protein n=1 Tax=Agreia bicolorata TaxID=110935 RepID=A0A1T4XJX4_9MICO|nr:energy-coupling factor transporter transmembrane component T [Agreia bicolorata]SKA89807.1 energy-coupling factor transport system permease protein [Agreia bicolorata]
MSQTGASGTRQATDPYAAPRDFGPVRFLHRLNPLSKIVAPLPAMALLLFARDIATPLIFCLFVLLMLVIGAHLRARTLVVLLVVLPLVVAVMSVSFGIWADAALVGDSPVLVEAGPVRFTVGAWLIGLATALRLTAVVLLALIGGLTSTGPDLVRSLVQQLRVPYRLGYTALAAFRFVPRFGHELDVIRQAHRVRGMSDGRGPIAAVARTAGYVVPLLAGAIRHAERVALAMDSRAFGAHPTRTERYLIAFRVRDWVFIVSFWALTAGVFTTAAGLHAIG